MTQKLLLISGMAHSGTTILQRALKHHPKVNGPVRETSFLVGKTQCSIRDEVGLLMDRYQGYSIIVEKTPLHLWFYENLIEAEPSSQMIVIIRDGKDVVASQKERFGRFYSAYRGANHWVDTAYKALKLSMLFPNNVKVVRYEHLVGTFDFTMREIFCFTGIDSDIYDYSAINRKSDQSYLSEKLEVPVFVNLDGDVSSCELSSNLQGAGPKDPQTFNMDRNVRKDDEINILPFRKLQVASPLFDGSGKSKNLSQSDLHDLKRCNKFRAMMNFMGYIMPK